MVGQALPKNFRVAQVVSTFPPYRGGMGNVAFQVADNLSKQGINVSIFTPKRNFADDDIRSYFKIHKLFPQFRFGNSAIVLQLVWHLLPYDVVHLHYPFLGAATGVILSKLLRGKKQKLIIHYHMDLVGKDWRRYIYGLYNYIFLKPLVCLADKVIVTSQDYYKASLLFKACAKNSAKFVTIPNGVDIDYFRPIEKDNRKISKYHLAEKKIVLFVGGLDTAHYFKGVNYLISAFDELKRDDLKLIIVGEGDLRPVYEQLVDSFGLNQKVIFTGYVPDEQLVKYYNLCDLFILPSIDKSEAFGMVLLEAMACGKAVIASDLPGVREVITKDVDGRLFKPKNVADLAEKLNKLIDQPEILAAYGKNGRQKVEQLYSWTKITSDLIKLYEAA